MGHCSESGGGETNGAFGRHGTASGTDDTAARRDEIGSLGGIIEGAASAAEGKLEAETSRTEHRELKTLASCQGSVGVDEHFEGGGEDAIGGGSLGFFRGECLGQFEHVGAEGEAGQIIFGGE